MAVERQYNQVDITVNYWELKSLADANNLTMETLGAMMQEAGASSVIVKEQSLSDLERRGKVDIVMGSDLTQTDYYESVNTEIQVLDTAVYVSILDETFNAQVTQYMDAKISGVTIYDGQVTVVEVPVRVPTNDAEVTEIKSLVGRIAVGFDWKMLLEVYTAGFDIVAQPVWWENNTIEGLTMVADEIKTIPNLKYISFGGGATLGYPLEIEEFAALLMVDGVPIAPISMVEMMTNTGVNKLIQQLDNEMVRTHMLTNQDMDRYELDTIMDRWMLAVNERNIRNLQVSFFNMNIPSQALEENLIYLQTLSDGIKDAGFVLGGTYEALTEITPNGLLLLVIGLGVAAGSMLLVLQMGLPKLSVLSFVLVTIIWFGAYLLSPMLARKLMALASVIIFPILSCLMMMKEERRNLVQSICSTLTICAISLIGAVFTVGLLADTRFLLKLDQFTGVKFAHIIPIGTVLLLVYIWRTSSPVETTKGLLEQAITYKWAILALLLGGAGIIYIMRTGNNSGEISTIEMMMRTFLGDSMGVRPRTKEFLIGYPCAILLFYYGAKRANWILVIPVVIGQVSLVNTYAHLHTPLMISLMRSMNGILLGIVVGIALWIGCKILEKLLIRVKWIY